MATWAEDIITALKNLEGVAPLKDIYEEVKKIRPLPHPQDLGASVRGTLERNSSDSTVFSGQDLFFSASGIGGGVWGLRSYEDKTQNAEDIDADGDLSAAGDENPGRKKYDVYRIIRDTELARQLKKLHDHRCQICGYRIQLPSGEFYSEAHHIKPLGSKHKGPDIADNIIVLCPNHHAMFDYGVIPLDIESVTLHEKHKISSNFIKYHNELIFVNSDH